MLRPTHEGGQTSQDSQESIANTARAKTKIMPQNPGENRNKFRYVARLSAWLLLATILISVVSGWGITRTGLIYQFSFGVIDRRFANAIHRGAQLPLVAFFLLHVLLNIRNNLPPRYSIKLGINLALILVGTLLFVIAAYLELFTI